MAYLLLEKGQTGYIDKKGKVVIPLKYEDAHNFKEDMAAVKSNGKWGFIDITGIELVAWNNTIINESIVRYISVR